MAQTRSGRFKEKGSQGLAMMSGFIQEAYHTKMEWPGCYSLLERIRRSDGEISVARLMMSSFASQVGFRYEIDWEDPTDDDKQFEEFGNQVLDDIEDGIQKWRNTLAAQVPFMGWGLWYVTPGLRSHEWSSPDSDWRSGYNDGLIGIRRLAWRSQSTLASWMEGDNSRVIGMNQRDPYAENSETIPLPFEECLHITFGDSNNPEGLSPLEAVWRMERLMYGYEVIMGIGAEHTAGYIKFKVKEALDADGENMVADAAEALAAASDGNFITEIMDQFEVDMISIPFPAARDILDTIRFYSLRKLQSYILQWVGMATTSGAGAFAAVSDASEMYMEVFNSMMQGFADQGGQQIGRWLIRNNPGSFGDLTRIPPLIATPVEKPIDLNALAGFVEKFGRSFSITTDDEMAVRRKSKFLPEQTAEMSDDEVVSVPQDDEDPFEDQDEIPLDEDPQEGDEIISVDVGVALEDYARMAEISVEDLSKEDLQKALMHAVIHGARRPFAVDPDEHPIDLTRETDLMNIDPDTFAKRLVKLAAKISPRISALIRANPKPDDSDDE